MAIYYTCLCELSVLTADQTPIYAASVVAMGSVHVVCARTAVRSPAMVAPRFAARHPEEAASAVTDAPSTGVPTSVSMAARFTTARHAAACATADSSASTAAAAVASAPPSHGSLLSSRSDSLNHSVAVGGLPRAPLLKPSAARGKNVTNTLLLNALPITPHTPTAAP